MYAFTYIAHNHAEHITHVAYSSFFGSSVYALSRHSILCDGGLSFDVTQSQGTLTQ